MSVVDASVGVKWLFREEEYVIESFALLARELASDEPILAPFLLRSEVTNTIRQRMRRQGVPSEVALALLDEFFAIPLTVVEPPGLYHQALLFAHDYGLPAAYDAHFVALAQINECDLWTADQRLLRQLNGRLSFVRWIGDYLP